MLSQISWVLCFWCCFFFPILKWFCDESKFPRGGGGGWRALILIYVNQTLDTVCCPRGTFARRVWQLPDIYKASLRAHLFPEKQCSDVYTLQRTPSSGILFAVASLLSSHECKQDFLDRSCLWDEWGSITIPYPPLHHPPAASQRLIAT